MRHMTPLVRVTIHGSAGRILSDLLCNIIIMEPSATADGTRLSTQVADLPQVNRRQADRLAHIDIYTVTDLLKHLPARYEQEHAESSIDDLPVESVGSARGTVTAIRVAPSARGQSRFEATFEDHRDRMKLVWFNAGYLRGKIHPGMVLRVQGKVTAYRSKPQMVNPQWQIIEDDEPVDPKAARLRPIYPATEHLPSWAIENIIDQVLDEVHDQILDPLPPALLKHRAMPVLADAFIAVHRPANEVDAKGARRRLVYNELLLLQLGIALKRYDHRHRLSAHPLPMSPAIDRQIRDLFPFTLTEAQGRVIDEIAHDLQRDWPMNRLLQGDVGSGKTVVALYALLMACCDRKQGVLMAPTEILAEQHFLSITDMLGQSAVQIGLLTAAAPQTERKELLAMLADGQIDILVGTQALLSEDVTFKDLAVVVVDEQHRFGVLQRAVFRKPDPASGELRCPHNLVMTATPIPRSLSLTLFADLDISTIDALPPGRAPIVTRVVGSDQSPSVYDYMAKRLAQGDQAYVVVPTIDDGGRTTGAQLKNLRAHTKQLQEKFATFRVSAVHGQLKRQTRESVMARFRAGKIDVLVATTVIEVGIDVPNARMMVVEHAERFGLAQLHQLRGRIGRSRDGRKSLCVFITDPATNPASQRMKAIGSTSDGFKVAQHDLEIRGMGDFFGTRQHGMPPLRVAQIPKDLDLLQLARRDAQSIVEDDPSLKRKDHAVLRQLLVQHFGPSIGLIQVG